MEMSYASNTGTIIAYDRTGAAYKNVAIDGLSLVLMGTTGNLVGIAKTPSCQLDVAQVIRACGSNAPATGSGLELAATSITSYNRTGSAYTALTLEGSSIILNPNTGNLVGIAKTPSCQLDVAQVIRACGSNAPSAGSGIEIGATTITSFNRTGSAYTALGIDSLTLNMNLNSGGDIKIQAASGKIGFFNFTAVVQQTASGASGYADSGATVVHSAGTFTGGVGATAYTIGDIVKALKNYGLLVN
jgi:hypothetical protein